MLFILKYVWKQVVTVIKLKCICSHSPLEFGYPPYNTVGQRHTEVRSQALRAPSIAQLPTTRSTSIHVYIMASFKEE